VKKLLRSNCIRIHFDGNFLKIYTPQGSVATQLSCSGIFNIHKCRCQKFDKFSSCGAMPVEFCWPGQTIRSAWPYQQQPWAQV